MTARLSARKASAMTNTILQVSNEINKAVSRSVTPAVSLSQSMTSLGGFSEAEEFKQLLKQASKKKWHQMVRMMGIVLIPVAVLIVMTGVLLSSTVSQYQLQLNTLEALRIYNSVDDLALNLQVERGLSATYLSSEGKDERVHEKLKQQRDKTEDLHMGVDWKSLQSVMATQLRGNTQQIISKKLRTHRDKVDVIDVTVMENVQWYTNLISLVASIADRRANFSGYIVSNTIFESFETIRSMFSAADNIGIFRALGASFFITCNLTDSAKQYMRQLTGQYDAYLKAAFKHSTESSLEYQETFVGSVLEENLLKSFQTIGNAQNCPHKSTEFKRNESRIFFDNMTKYLGIVVGMRSKNIKFLFGELQRTSDMHRTNVILLSLGSTVIIVVCVVLALWYGQLISTMLTKIKQFSDQLRKKNTDLAVEKAKTDYLLFQMLPKTIAEQLKSNKEVQAEYFASVSIYFSDIVGFTTLAGRSSPYQIVDLLNELYQLFDNAIDRYNIYKVETIGDAYMCASGLPEPCEDHAAQVAKLSLDLIEKIQGYEIPHMPGEQLKIRIGCHCGSCVAGVVGTKMPRYCLFGNTVNTASRMESNGSPNKIHVSKPFNDMLLEAGGFTLESRGEMEIKGKGMMNTYFLVGSCIAEKSPKIKFAKNENGRNN